MNKRGLFIVFDGLDGAGKTTALNAAATMLRDLGETVVTTREPGGSELGEKIRKMLFENSMSGKTEALLFAASRNDHIESTIIPALQDGAIVLCDRFTDSTYAYQCAGRGVEESFVLDLERKIVNEQDAAPDYTFYFYCDQDVAEERVKSRSGDVNNRFDEEQVAFKARVRAGYTKREAEAIMNNKHHYYLDTTHLDCDQVSDVVNHALKTIIANR